MRFAPDFPRFGSSSKRSTESVISLDSLRNHRGFKDSLRIIKGFLKDSLSRDSLSILKGILKGSQGIPHCSNWSHWNFIIYILSFDTLCAQTRDIFGPYARSRRIYDPIFERAPEIRESNQSVKSG